MTDPGDVLVQIEQRASDAAYAPSGAGPRADEWRDKPHRIVYDLTTDIGSTVAALRAVLDLHRAREFAGDVACECCGHWGDDYPCPTICAVADALGAADVQ